MNRAVLSAIATSPSPAVAFAAVAWLGFVMPSAYAADWTFDTDAGTLSDGGWTFAATADGGALTVGGCTAWPDAGATLDFSKPVSGGYTISVLDTKFSECAGRAGLSALVLPEDSISEIAADAFNGCTALASVTPYLPDSVRTLGERAFQGVPAAQPLTLENVAVVPKLCFASSGVMSAAFGPALKTLVGGWAMGCFKDCAALAGVSFSSEMSGGDLGGSNGSCVFEKCTAMEGTVDLTGFSVFGGRPWYGAKNTGVTTLVFSEDVRSVDPQFFQYLGALATIRFTGAAPQCAEAIFSALDYPSEGAKGNQWAVYYNSGSLMIVVPEAQKSSWAQYCEGGEINEIDSELKSDYIGDGWTRKVYLVYEADGGTGETGDWIYADGTLTSASQGWTFAASQLGRMVTLGEVSVAPEHGELDLSTSVTDASGAALRITEIGPRALAGREELLSVVLPDDLIAVGSGAFDGCVSLAAVSPYLPDTVASVGENAFRGVPAQQDLHLAGAADIGSGAFQRSGIGSATFGPVLKTIGGGYSNGAFQSCMWLTNMYFDAATTGAQFTAERVLAGCSALTEIDLSGFSAVGGRPFENCSSLTSVVFSASLSAVSTNLLANLTHLQAVKFLGAPPAQVDGIFNGARPLADRPSDTQAVVTHVPWKFRKEWAALCENGVLNKTSSTWARGCVSESVENLAMRKLVLFDGTVGLAIILR